MERFEHEILFDYGDEGSISFSETSEVTVLAKCVYSDCYVNCSTFSDEVAYCI